MSLKFTRNALQGGDDKPLSEIEPPPDITRRDFVFVGLLSFIGLPALLAFATTNVLQINSGVDALKPPFQQLAGAGIGAIIGLFLFFCVTCGISLNRSDKHSRWQTARSNEMYRQQQQNHLIEVILQPEPEIEPPEEPKEENNVRIEGMVDTFKEANDE